MSRASSAYSELISGQLRKATSDLRSIQQLLTHDGIDPRVLLDFREAVDNVRHVAWGVQQWLDLHDARQDTSSVMEMLVVHRIRVATQLNNDLALTAEAGELARGFPGFTALRTATRRLLELLDATPKAERASG